MEKLLQEVGIALLYSIAVIHKRAARVMGFFRDGFRVKG
jgi:hypothetical protein